VRRRAVEYPAGVRGGAGMTAQGPTAQVLAMLLVAAALMVTPGPAGPRSRLPQPVTAIRSDLAPGIRGAIGHWASRWLRRGADTGGESLALAGAWELLAASVRAVAEGLGVAAGPALRRTAELLALGADPPQAWQPALECTATARLARAARRSGRSGTALAESLTRLAAEVRAGAREQSEARAQRAGVLIAAPLGLCFLPAFLAIGVVPVLIGLAAGLMGQW
jgi:Type II secretion system (T2SS), protein F